MQLNIAGTQQGLLASGSAQIHFQFSLLLLHTLGGSRHRLQSWAPPTKVGEPSSCVPTELVLLPSAAGHLGNQLMGKRSLSFCLANKMRVKSVSASSLHSEEPGGGGGRSYFKEVIAF